MYQQQMSISNNKKKRTAQLHENPSRVLLTCVYDTIVLEITNEIVYSRFSPHGNVLRILIFERGEVTKFFIEFQNTENAVRAKRALDGTKLYQAICKMNIYYSNFSSVDLKHQTTEGVALDFFQQKRTQPYPCQQGLLSSPRCKENKRPIFNSYVLLGSEELVENNYHCLGEEEDEEEGEGALRDLTRNENIIAREIEKTIENDINSLLRSEKKKPFPSSSPQGMHSWEKNTPPLFPVAVEQSSHFLSFFIRQSIANYRLYNLFSNFGNISFIKQTRHCVFLKYKSQEFAEIAKSYLEGHWLNGQRLSFFTLAEIGQALPNQQEFSQITYYDQSYDRFTTTKSMTINPPSQTLHVSSLRRECCNAQTLRECFERFGRVDKVEILTRCADKNMALVKFCSVQESFEAISEMHGRGLAGRKMQISFTKSKVL